MKFNVIIPTYTHTKCVDACMYIMCVRMLVCVCIHKQDVTIQLATFSNGSVKTGKEMTRERGVVFLRIFLKLITSKVPTVCLLLTSKTHQ